jgi:long-chain fatty acid transport protein
VVRSITGRGKINKLWLESNSPARVGWISLAFKRALGVKSITQSFIQTALMAFTVETEKMDKKITLRLIPALLAVAFSGGASASGFQLMGEQSAAAIGNAGAGSAAVAENASTIFYNPAGMTQLQDREISLGVSAVKTSFEFSNSGSSVGTLQNTGDGGNGGGWAFVPNAYMSWALNKDWYVGLGIGAPFGLKTEYDSPWKGSAHSNSFEIKTINLNPSVAWRANEWLSLGFGVNWQRVEAEYKRAAAVSTAGLAGSDITLNLDDDAWGWNVGALFTLSPATKIGVSYRSTVKYSTTGDIGISGNGTPAGNGTAAVLVAAGGAADASAKIEMPDTFILSVAHKLNDKWELLGDVSWTGWSSIPKVDIMRTSGPLNGSTAQTLDTAFDDAWRFAIGANYKIDEAWKLRMGLAYDQTPVPNAQHRLTSLPDNDRTWFSAGAQWKPNKTSALDIGLAYIYVKNAEIDNNQIPTPLNAQTASQNRGYVKGNYDDSVWLFGAQYSMGF